jgi:hypothetical protein
MEVSPASSFHDSDPRGDIRIDLRVVFCGFPKTLDRDDVHSYQSTSQVAKRHAGPTTTPVQLYAGSWGWTRSLLWLNIW